VSNKLWKSRILKEAEDNNIVGKVFYHLRTDGRQNMVLG
jgi:hypothetical protein